MLDFTELGVAGTGLEQLAREMLLVMDLHPSWSGVGPDAGHDLLFEERGLEALGRKPRRWLVSCKDKSTSGVSVGVSDLDGFVDAVEQHKAQAFLLVCTTHPSSAAVERLRAVEANHNGSLATHVWDGVTLERLLTSARMWAVAQAFMPVSANAAGWKIFGTESPNRWVAVHRGHYFHLSKRVGGDADFDLESLERRMDEIEALEVGGTRCRIRGVWLDDAKGGGYLWFVDYMVPEGQDLPDAAEIEQRLSGGVVFDDGQPHNFEIEVRPIEWQRDHFDMNHYDYYERLPPFV